jgi:monoamine oxidase
MSDEKTGASQSGLTRRRFMKSAGAGALVAGGLGVGGKTPGAERSPEEKPRSGGSDAAPDYDAVVLGGGFAGVTAARELRMHGLRVLLLEARRRVGGRTFTSEFAGHPTELGGAYFHWTQPHAWAELTRYGIEIEEPEQTASPKMAWRSAGEVRRSSVDEAGLLMFQAAGQFFYDAQQVLERPHAPFFVPGIEKLDRLSVQERIDGLGLPRQQRDLLDALFGSSCHCALSEAALTEMLRWYTLSGASLMNMVDASGRYTLRGGTRGLIESMLADARPELRFSTPVRAIRQEAGQVIVTTEEGETTSARALVVTVPLNVLGNIEFDPPLSPGKQAAASEGHAGSGVKLHIQLRGDLGTLNGMAPWPAPISTLITEYSGPDGTVFTAFGPSGTLLDLNDDEAIQAAVRLMLPDAEVLQAVGWDWNADPFARGTWCVYRPGQLTKSLRELQRPEGRVIYAGADNASGWRGFIDGAIESGLRAGREVVRLLG